MLDRAADMLILDSTDRGVVEAGPGVSPGVSCDVDAAEVISVGVTEELSDVRKVDDTT